MQDNEWFKIHTAVRGKNIQVRLNGILVVDYVEPTPPVIPAGPERERCLDHGTFALQCHNDGSYARFRRVRVRPLPEDAATPDTPPQVDDTFRQIIETGPAQHPHGGLPRNLKGGLTIEQLLAKSRRDGIQYGVVAAGGWPPTVGPAHAASTGISGLRGAPGSAAALAASVRLHIERLDKLDANSARERRPRASSWTDSWRAPSAC